MNKRLVLASASPRRAALLKQMGVSFAVQAVDVDEQSQAGERPADLVVRLAREKAQEAFRRCAEASVGKSDLYFLGADTLGEINGHLLVKPESYQHFYDMMREMAGNTHTIYTAVSLVGSACEWSVLSTSSVTFRSLSDHEIACYWYSGEPQDKAGGYAIQGKAGMFVDVLTGSYSGVVGLPLNETAQLLQQAGFNLWLDEEQRMQE